jgi:hypothetical protein
MEIEPKLQLRICIYILASPLSFACIFVVSPETEEIIYTDEFFRCKNIIVNALDNVEARRYVDR